MPDRLPPNEIAPELVRELVKAVQGMGPHAGDYSHLVDNATADDLREALKIAARRLAYAERYVGCWDVDQNMPVYTDVHTWFGLTYSNYLVLQRTLLQSMPDDWQQRFVRCLEELEEAFAHIEHPGGWWVRAHDGHGKFITDPVPHYERGRAHVEPHPLARPA